MATLNERILSLEAKIEKYENKLDLATEEKAQDRLSALIVSARETLNRLLDEKKEKALQTAGTFI
jgi:hypothetical protein